ncbi:hypothetical protein CA51_26830 [Rosistilla oblonga]|uniref:AbiTii domain-containing protein n=1 Tax=Rosistilla oblonga TaxID=2527990 RepID=UPI001189320B|nr:hypothetical protein [Rosistilla oblonga]QDV12797.1 hypothetical protein CA51_26830 [Rosistilla oblonga]
MQSLVLELQRLASEDATSLPELLRKALIVAKKLGLPEFASWIDNELNGYPNTIVPAYRKIRGTLRARHPYRGAIPFHIGDADMDLLITTSPCSSGVSDLYALISESNGTEVVASIPHEMKTYLMQIQELPMPLEPIVVIGKNHVSQILDAIRTKVLNWSLELESQGILGENMTFSKQEKEKAHSSITITNFQGVLGDVKSSTLNLKMQIGDITSLTRTLKEKGVGDAEIAELEDAITKDGARDRNLGPEVSKWVGKMTMKAADGSWQIGIGAAGELLATALQLYYDF